MKSQISNPASGPGGEAAVAAASGLVEHFFRHEAGRLHGALTRLLGPGNLSLVEDVAQEALLRALRTWSISGCPANPSAWITRVAMNLARDAMRHRRMAAAKEADVITFVEQTAAPSTLAAGTEPAAVPAPGTTAVTLGGPGLLAAAQLDGEYAMRDDALRLMFVCCHPTLAADAQVVLALKVLGGFSTAEIARAFLSSEAAIEKQLTRTKQRIRTTGVGFSIPEGGELAPRLDGVLATLYLMFNEGYKATAGERLVRDEVSREAIRLTSLLVAHPAGDTPRAHALLALMLLTSARFPSRVDHDGALLRLPDQDRTSWDRALIDRGLSHLARSATGTDLSEYHLQAGIAACHCLAADYASTDWPRILRHYDELARLKPSPVVALNRAVAIAHVHGPQAALAVIAAIPQRDRLESHHLLHAVEGELHWQLGDNRAAAASFRRALRLAEVGPEQVHLLRMLERASAGSAGESAG